tara:strand:- start:1330 stop:1695 length:366 start_codon:yes stop_codon:yes gene_type:complete
MRKLALTKPIFLVNKRILKILSKVSPIEIGAITLGPVVISREPLNDVVKRHETIHWQQYIDCGIIGFPVLYLIYWLYGLAKYRDGKVAYFMIPFEQEAYAKEGKEFYLLNRKRWCWRSYRV